MGVLSLFFPNNPAKKTYAASGFKTFTEYNPVFYTWSGKIYEEALCRAAIEKFSTSCAKLKPEVVGSSKPNVKRMFETWPNPYMTWPKFLGRLATITETDTTAFVVPLLDRSDNVVGLFPLKPITTEVIDLQDEPWLRFTLATGDQLAIEMWRVAIITRFQYESDFFGSGNGALDGTLSVMDAQRQAEQLAIRNGARIRFIGRLTGQVHEDDIKAKRERFYEDNLSPENTTGLMLYDNTYDSLKQIEEQHYTIDTDEMKRINDSVFSYFGTNEDILHNHYTEEHWGAYYEGKIEPWAVQVSESLTRMLYTSIERRHGNYVMFSSNRLEYASNASKRNMVRDMIDRGVMSINEAREVLQLPPIPGGEVFFARGEYKDAQGIAQSSPVKEKDFDLGGDDDIYNDTDGRGEEDKFDG